MSSARRDVLEPVVHPRRLQGAAREHERYAGFCDAHGIAASPEATVLYLTWLLDSGAVHGRGLRYRLHLLDLHARLGGTRPPSDDPAVRRYVRGLHREASLASPEQGADPLYLELLAHVVEGVMRPEPEQVHDVALILLANATGLPSTALAGISWRHVRFRPRTVELAVPPMLRRGPRKQAVVSVPARRGPTCCRCALARWRRLVGPAEQPVFSLDGRSCDLHRITRAVKLLRHDPCSTAARRPLTGRALVAVVDDLLAPHPRAARDRALLMVGFAAALRTQDAELLRQGDVRVEECGLVLRLPRRADPWVAVPRSREVRLCPVAAWETWLTALQQRTGAANEDLPAFPQIAGDVVKPLPLAAQGLNRIVHQRCAAVGLRGDWWFTSLRAGFIRSAIRSRVPEHVIARHVGLTAMHSVHTHSRRELILSSNAAALVGL